MAGDVASGECLPTAGECRVVLMSTSSTENQNHESKTGRVGMSIIQITKRLRQEGHKFKDSQRYRTLEKALRAKAQNEVVPMSCDLCPGCPVPRVQ